ncbi:MAG TPA: hypothetical protein VL357_05700 [Rariglobus sp.]|jgi:hypothetical protein|nr:hypothetical protein [Rariglobus sp.]
MKSISFQSRWTSFKSSRKGFALLITITLLAFLVLLLVSLSSLTKVETQIASNNQDIGKARQSALMALNIAVGQLQKYAGSDSVTTARADILPLSSTPLNTSNFSAYYTGVWGPLNALPDAGDRTPSPLATWLVSGNETAPLNRLPSTPVSAGDILIVDKSVNSQAALQVKVPKTTITVPTSALLGQASAAGSTVIGHYAYWVGDDSVKAKVNVADPYATWTATTAGAPAMTAQSAFSSTAPEYFYRREVSQRFGIENVASDLTSTSSGYATPLGGTTPIGSTYDVADGVAANFHRDLLKISGYNQLSLLAGFSSPSSSANSISSNRFHDLTTVSYGLLTNSAYYPDSTNSNYKVNPGGLKEDIAWHLEATTTTSLLSGSSTGSSTAKAIQTRGASNSYNSQMSWDHLRTYYQLADAQRPLIVKPPIANTVAPIANDKNGVESVTPVPIVTQVRIFFQPSAVNNANIEMRLAFVVANPYNEVLRIPSGGLSFVFNYALTIGARFNNGTGSNFSITTDQKARTDPSNATGLNVLDQLIYGGGFPGKTAGTNSTSPSTPAATTPCIFTYSSQLDLQPGSAVAFTLGQTATIGPNITVPLFLGVNSSNYLLMQGTWPTSDNKVYVITPNLPTYTTTTTDPVTGITTTTSTTPASRFQVQMWLGQPPAVPSQTPPPNNIFPIQRLSDLAWTAPSNYSGDQIGVMAQLVAPSDNYSNSINLYLTRNIKSPLVYTYFSTTQATNGYATRATSEVQNTSIATDLSTFTLNGATSVAWGNSNTIAKGNTSVVLYDIPARSSVNQPVFMSLGQLQNADLSINSVYQSNIGVSSQSYSGTNMNPGGVTDVAFLYNEAFWDRFCCSTVPQNTGSNFNPATDNLANSRYVIKSSIPRAQLTRAMLTSDPYGAARYLMINGPFNVNSTSVEAWKAVLAGTKGLSLNGEAIGTSGVQVPFFRSVHQTGFSQNARLPRSGGAVGTAPSSDVNNAWSGYVNLTDLTTPSPVSNIVKDSDITQLAKAIVARVRVMGPFNSLAQFINHQTLTNNGNNGLKDNQNKAIATSSLQQSGAIDGALILAATNYGLSSANNQVYQGIPGWLTQADILTAIGPVLTTRSDTFTIRTYGDYVNPVTNETSKAYCEAVVQRMQDPVTTTGAPASIPLADYIPQSSSVSPAYINPPGSFGRRFVVVSFRWLSPNDI